MLLAHWVTISAILALSFLFQLCYNCIGLLLSLIILCWTNKLMMMMIIITLSLPGFTRQMNRMDFLEFICITGMPCSHCLGLVCTARWWSKTVSSSQTLVDVDCGLRTSTLVSFRQQERALMTGVSRLLARPWNSLPAELRQSDVEIGQFRRLRRTFLFEWDCGA